MKALQKLHDAVKEHEKVVLETSEDAHTDKLLQLRMSKLTHMRFITTHYPESHVRKEMLGFWCTRCKDSRIRGWSIKNEMVTARALSFGFFWVSDFRAGFALVSD